MCASCIGIEPLTNVILSEVAAATPSKDLLYITTDYSFAL